MENLILTEMEDFMEQLSTTTATVTATATTGDNEDAKNPTPTTKAAQNIPKSRLNGAAVTLYVTNDDILNSPKEAFVTGQSLTRLGAVLLDLGLGPRFMLKKKQEKIVTTDVSEDVFGQLEIWSQGASNRSRSKKPPEVIINSHRYRYSVIVVKRNR